MFVYRIVKTKARTKDLSGAGAFKAGGRWNSKGVYMLYTSENSSLAYLENLVHFDKSDYPPDLYIMKIEVSDSSSIYELPKAAYPSGWQKLELLENRALGDRLMKERNHLGIKVRSSVNIFEYNYLLNPLFPGYYDLVTVVDVVEIKPDDRLV